MVSVVYPCGEGNSEEILLNTKDGLIAYFQTTKTIRANFSDSIRIDAHSIPAHTDKYCKKSNLVNGNCIKYNYRYVGAYTIPAKTYNVSDSGSFKVIDDQGRELT